MWIKRLLLVVLAMTIYNLTQMNVDGKVRLGARNTETGETSLLEFDTHVKGAPKKFARASQGIAMGHSFDGTITIDYHKNIFNIKGINFDVAIGVSGNKEKGEIFPRTGFHISW